MPARGVAGQDDSIGVDVVLLSIPHRPTQSATAVLHGCWRERNVSHAVFNVDDILAHLQIRQKEKCGASAIAENPSTAVIIDQSRNGCFFILSLPHVELQRGMVRHAIGNVRLNPVLLSNGGSPAFSCRKRRRFILRKSRKGTQAAQQQNEKEPKR